MKNVPSEGGHDYESERDEKVVIDKQRLTGTSVVATLEDVSTRLIKLETSRTKLDHTPVKETFPTVLSNS